MISLASAINTVLEHSRVFPKMELVPLWESLGRVLASDINSDINMPPFDKSAVDGYACRKIDLRGDLRRVYVQK
jgi:molybdopterin molybdotransferase